MKRILSLLSAGGLVLLASTSIRAESVFATNPTGTWVQGPLGTAGTQFKVGATAVRILALGFCDDGTAGGLTAAHTVGIYDLTSFHNLLASVVVKSGTASPLHDGTRWENLGGYIDLNANTSYMLAFTQTAGQDTWNWASGANQITLDSHFTLPSTGNTFVPGAGLNYPGGTPATTGKYFFGGNIELTDVPEPQTCVMSGMVLVGLAGYVIRLRRAAAR